VLGGRYLIRLVSGVPVVAVPAEVDVTTCGRLREALLEASGPGHATVVVDMTRTPVL
jgi:anti-anti-sigma regulatory factor